MKVIEWRPHPEVKNELTFHSLNMEDRTLSIVFRDKEANAICRITFPSPLVFRHTSKQDPHTSSDVFKYKYNIAKNSNYLAWFRQSSSHETLNPDLVHYAVSALDEYLEIITLVPPLVTWTPLDTNQPDPCQPSPWASLD